jgi:hypothetical protein
MHVAAELGIPIGRSGRDVLERAIADAEGLIVQTHIKVGVELRLRLRTRG